MKKIFSIFLVCCTAFAYADGEPVFEETNEKIGNIPLAHFAAEEPIFEDDDEEEARHLCEDCPPSHAEDGIPEMLFFPGAKCPDCDGDNNPIDASYVSWNRYKAFYGIEKVYARFPHRPNTAQSSNIFTAYAWDYSIMYSVSGYFPPLGNIIPIMWFDEILFNSNLYPYNLLSHVIFQDPSGVMVMDYVTYDCVQNTVIKSRALVTPFNGYILQCVKPNGARDHFDYFIDNFFIRCE